MTLPKRKVANSHRANLNLRCPSHLRFVRSHACCVCGSMEDIEAAHVRGGTGGGMGMKPSDRWCISLCRDHHAEQHLIGEISFAHKHVLAPRELAEEFARKSPHWNRLKDMP